MELEIGQMAERTMMVTDEQVEASIRITGDHNALHFGEAFAATRFGRLVGQGGITTGLLHALVAIDLPGPGTVFLRQGSRFTAPVYIGDTMKARADVARAHPGEPVTESKVRAWRGNGETVVEGTA